MKELEEKIHDYIKNLYKKEFIGLLQVKKINDIYELTLGIPVEDIPTKISLQTDSEEEFLEYVCDELKKRNYIRTQYFTVKRRPDNGIHEKGRRVSQED